MNTPKENPIEPPDHKIADVVAIQDVMDGKANEQQQVRAMKYIIEVLCGTYDFAFRPDQRLTDVALGKQFVGKQLVTMIKLNREYLKQKEAKK